MADELTSLVVDACARQGQPATATGPFLIGGGRHPLCQGWKLHVAAGVGSAMEIAQRCLPVILSAGTAFKMISSIEYLAALNDGQGGVTQIGKFITLYPSGEQQAIRLATTLDAVTRGLCGPRVPSDRRLNAGSLVYYRFGGFGNLQMRTTLGETVPAIKSPTGELIPDDRNRFNLPDWVDDPFVGAGLAGDIPPMRRVVKDRFVLLAVLDQSPRCTVYLGLDLAGPRKCVVKTVIDAGDFEIDRLRREYAALSSLAHDGRFPAPIDFSEDSGQGFLAMEDIDGEPLERYLISLRNRNMRPCQDDVLRWGCEIADMLQTVHEHGFLHGDLKVSNLIVAPDGGLRLIDFDTAWNPDSPESPSGRWGGTRGYLSPQRLSGNAPTASDDVYALGALLYLLLTGAEPSCAPDPFNLLACPIEVLNPAADAGLVTVVRRCLDHDPDRRALAGCRAALPESVGPLPQGHPETPRMEAQQCLQLARQIGDLLCDAVTPDGSGFVWRDGLFGQPASLVRDLNTGVAGAVLALTELADEFDEPRYDAALAASAQWLIDTPLPAGPLFPGLYIGDAGVAAALLRAGRYLNGSELFDAAMDLEGRIALQPFGSPDLFCGTAGRVRAHLLFFEATSDQRHLDHAQAAATLLLDSSTRESGSMFWTMPSGCADFSGKRLTGYAHGAAGIADVLLDLYQVTGNQEVVDAAVGVAHWLARLAVPVLDNDEGLNWPSGEGTSPTMAFWCHGAAGIIRFLARLHSIVNMPGALGMAQRAAKTVATGTRWSGASQCHGLAGNIECLLDMHAATGEKEYLDDAREMAVLLPAFAVEACGRATFITENNRSGPGFTHGCAGVASCLLRLAHPSERSHALSTDGFRAVAKSRPPRV